MTEAEMIQCAIDEGFAAAAIVDTSQIVFDPTFRPYCEENLAVSMVLTTPAHPIAAARKK